MFKLLLQLYNHINSRRRKQFLLLLILTLISSLAEVVSLGAIVPFIGVLTEPEIVFNNPQFAFVVDFLNISSASDLVLPLTITFATAALIAGALRLLLLWVSILLTNATGADLSIEVYRRTLYQPYSIHIARSSSEVISGITQKVGAATSILISIVTVVTSSALFIAILGTLLAINPMVATVAFVGFGLSYSIIAFKTRRRLRENSHTIAREQTQVVKTLQEGLGAIRDVLLDGTQTVYCDVYSKSVMNLRRANGENSYINQAPRFLMETVGMILVAALAYALSLQNGGIAAALPVLAALALGAQRLLPLLQQLYGNWSVIAGSQAALIDVIDLLEQPLPKESLFKELNSQEFIHDIKFEDVSFKYGNNELTVLNDFNLIIEKGKRIGFIGSTGSGKSTALDLLMALLEPTEGRILVDGQPINNQNRTAWQSLIAHVPQNIFLSDASMAENIAFGIPPEDIDYERVKLSAEQAQISSFIESNNNGYDAFVGERGVRISGGQRQRIGIARALYKQAKILIFDEATSALDSETEKTVMSTIDNISKDITIVMIAHRISTLRNCDSIVELKNGKIVSQGEYKDFIN